MKKTITSFLLLCLLAVSASGSTIYVNAAATGNNDGTTWADAYTDLQSALAAAVSGDEIWVAAGTYKPTSGTDRSIFFVMKSGVAIYGGFPNTGNPGFGNRDWAGNVTTLSADIGTTGDNTDNSYHVISNDGNGLTSTAVLDGFTLSGGNANTSSPHNLGGGMYNSSSSPSVSNCTFSGNTAGGFGGGMYNVSSSPSVSNCTFSGNSGPSGGAMYNATSSAPAVTNCTFSGNSATASSGTNGGAGIFNSSSSPSVTNCTFSGNSSSHAGGGIYNNGSSPTVTNCTFSSNSSAGVASNGGGGMFNTGSAPTVTNCIFSGNSANQVGGGLQSTSSSSPTVINCIFLGNSAANGGGCNFGNGTPTVTNCSFSGNTATTAGGAVRRSGGTVTLVNCILWGNSTETNGTMTITYSIVQGGFSGTGNLDADPEFVDQPPVGLGTTGDLHLSTGSAAYNAGNNASVPGGVTTDLDGNPRIAFSTVDMGAYESQTSLLPVELLFFTAKQEGQAVRLAWATASERDNEGFEVQRSADGRAWGEIGFVVGNGSTAEERQYEFFDEKPLTTPLEGGRGVIYYRLRQTDFDGGEAFSKVVSVEGGTNWQSVLRVSPNPARQGMTSLHFSETPKSEAFLKIFDCTGRQIFSKKIELENGGQPVPVDLSACPPGIYLARLELGGEVRTERLVLAK